MTVLNEINNDLQNIENYLMAIIDNAIATQVGWSNPKLLAYDIDEKKQFFGIYSVNTPDGERNVRFITNGKTVRQGIEE